MRLMRPDIVVDIEYDIAQPIRTIIKTNAKREMIVEILEDWILDQIDRGASTGVAVERGSYHITIGLELATDGFATRSDTGNEGLTCGIVMQVIGILDALTVQPILNEFTILPM